MLTDDGYRSWVMRQVHDPFLRDFWQNEFESYDERFKREAIAPIQNKVGQLLLSPVIRNIVGQVQSKVRNSIAAMQALHGVWQNFVKFYSLFRRAVRGRVAFLAHSVVFSSAE